MALGALVASSAGLLPLATPAVAASCDPTGAGYYTPVATQYGSYNNGQIDGSEASINTPGMPSVCDLGADHTLETAAMVLPHYVMVGSTNYFDTVENGVVEGYISTLQGTAETTPSAAMYYYQEANIFTQGASELNMEWSDSGGGGHAYSLEEGVACCWQLYAQPVTDATSWARLDLPVGDNPGWIATYQGEVYNDPLDQMGTAIIFGPEVHHAGAPSNDWVGWSGTVSWQSDYPYCQQNYPAGGTYSYENYGPVQPGQGGCP